MIFYVPFNLLALILLGSMLTNLAPGAQWLLDDSQLPYFTKLWGICWHFCAGIGKYFCFIVFFISSFFIYNWIWGWMLPTLINLPQNSSYKIKIKHLRNVSTMTFEKPPGPDVSLWGGPDFQHYHSCLFVCVCWNRAQISLKSLTFLPLSPGTEITGTHCTWPWELDYRDTTAPGREF